MSNPIVNITLSDKILNFTLGNTDVSIANAIRRTVLSDIQTPVFEESNMNFIKNTSRLHNEILKQRLGCIPIHCDDVDIPLENYIIEIYKKNEGTSIVYVTTEDFKIKNIKNDKYLNETEVRRIFPPDPISKDFILFARLRPKITKNIPGEEIAIIAKMSLSNAKNNGMYNVVSTMSYRNTIDPILQDQAWKKKLKQLQKLELSGEQINLEQENWKNGPGKRYYTKNSFDFIVETLGNFSNEKIIKKACEIIIQKLKIISENREKLSHKEAESNLPNSFDITLKNEDYTIGKIIESILHYEFFGNNLLSYVGFSKKHPHDDDSIIRIAFEKERSEETIIPLISEVCVKGMELFKNIKTHF